MTSQPIIPEQQMKKSVNTAEAFVLLGCCAPSHGACWLTFQDCTVNSFLRVRKLHLNTVQEHIQQTTHSSTATSYIRSDAHINTHIHTNGCYIMPHQVKTKVCLGCISESHQGYSDTGFHGFPHFYQTNAQVVPRSMLLPETPRSNQLHKSYANSCESHRMKIKIIYLVDEGCTHGIGSCVIIPDKELWMLCIHLKTILPQILCCMLKNKIIPQFILHLFTRFKIPTST